MLKIKCITLKRNLISLKWKLISLKCYYVLIWLIRLILFCSSQIHLLLSKIQFSFQLSGKQKYLWLPILNMLFHFLIYSFHSINDTFHPFMHLLGFIFTRHWFPIHNKHIHNNMFFWYSYWLNLIQILTIEKSCHFYTACFVGKHDKNQIIRYLIFILAQLDSGILLLKYPVIFYWQCCV